MNAGQRERLARCEQLNLLMLGLTHDFNNTATCMLDELSRLEKHLRQLRELVLAAAASARRAEALGALAACDRSVDTMAGSLQTAVGQARQLQQVSRYEPRRLVGEGSNLVDSARRALNLLGGRVRPLSQRLSTEPIRVAVSAQTSIRVLTNLLLNAVEAVSPTASDPRVGIHIWMEGRRAVCEVRDNGRGVPSPIIPRLFEPFTTSRADSGGNGLGLAVSRELIRGEGGELELQQTGPMGSVFRLTLPLLDTPATDPAARATAELVVALSPPIGPSPAP